MSKNLPAPAPQSLPLSYSEACRAIAFCVRVDECRGWADKAAAVAAYAKMVRNVQLEADAKRIRLRATRRIGEIIGKDGRTAIVRLGIRGNAVVPEAAGLSNWERTRSRAIARIPDAMFEKIAVAKDVPSPDLLARAYVAKNGAGHVEDTRRQLNAHSNRHTGARRRRLNGRIASLNSQIKNHHLLDFYLDRQPVRNLAWDEVRAWAKKHLHIAVALLLLGERFDESRRVADCVDERDADRVLELAKSKLADFMK